MSTVSFSPRSGERSWASRRRGSERAHRAPRAGGGVPEGEHVGQAGRPSRRSARWRWSRAWSSRSWPTSCRWARPTTATSSPSDPGGVDAGAGRGRRRGVPALLAGPVPALLAAAPALRGPGAHRSAGRCARDSPTAPRSTTVGEASGRAVTASSEPPDLHRGCPHRSARPARRRARPQPRQAGRLPRRAGAHRRARSRDEISRYVQALAAKGLGQGSPVAVLAPNRPEVLFNMGANMLRRLPHHAAAPAGLARRPRLRARGRRHRDAGLRPAVLRRAGRRRWRERVPGLKHLLSLRPDARSGDDYIALAATFEPRPLVAPDGRRRRRARPRLHRRHDRQAQGRDGHATGRAPTMTQIQMAEWEWPDEARFLICTPLSHAGAAFFIPMLLRGGSLVVLPVLRARAGAARRSRSTRITATMLVPDDALRAARPPRRSPTRDLSSLRDRLLRRRRHVADAAAGGDRASWGRSSSSSTARPRAR